VYQPATRLLTVLELLESRPVVSAAEIAAHLGVDRRSVRRYVVSLQDLGIPVEGVRGRLGGYRLGPGLRLAPLILTEDQAVAVGLGLLLIQHGGPAVGPAAVAGAQERLTRILPLPVRQRVDALRRAVAAEVADTGPRPDAQTVALLAGAADTGRRVHLRHGTTRATTERDVDPYGVVTVLGHWYVVGWCHLRRSIRSFRIDRVVDARLAAERFSRPDGFDSLAHLTAGIAGMPARFRASVLLDAPLAEVAARIPAAYAELEPHPQGTIARSPVDDLDAHARWLVSLGFGFRVIGPEALRDAVADLARTLAAVSGAPGL
jgi:predicted DNA-binding transcriptional regulator YafY